MDNHSPTTKKNVADQAVIMVVDDNPDSLKLLSDILSEQGYQVRKDIATCSVPVIFISGLGNSADKVRAFAIGGQDYITKPFEDTEVLARVKTHLVLRKKEVELQQALKDIQQLKGILPICCECKQIRDDQGYWQQVEQYISEHSDVQFSHGYCPTCYEKKVEELKNL